MANASIHTVRFEYNGGVLVSERSGREDAGTHMLFLHGWGANRESLRGIATLFQHTHCVHLIDLPGFGEAPVPPGPWSTIEYGDLVQQYLLEHVQRHAILIGHSFGGRVSVRVASRRLAQVHGLVLLGVPGLPLPVASGTRLKRSGIRLLRRALIALKPLVGPAGVDWHTRRFGSKDYQAAGPLRPVLVRTVTEDLTESAKTIACPTLLVWGTDDTEAPPWLAHRYKELIGTRAALLLLPHKDHFLYAGTGAHLIGEKMRRWLKESVA